MRELKGRGEEHKAPMHSIEIYKYCCTRYYKEAVTRNRTRPYDTYNICDL